jgi:glutamate synthase domain-containing protein 1
MTHRGATGADSRDGDGAGVMTAIPHAFFKRESEMDMACALPEPGEYAVGNVFFKATDQQLRLQKATFEKIAVDLGLRVLGWRHVPTDGTILGPAASSREPTIYQPFVVLRAHYGDGTVSQGGTFDAKHFERQLYVLRKHATHTMSVFSIFSLLGCKLKVKPNLLIYEVHLQKDSMSVRCPRRTSSTRVNYALHKYTTTIMISIMCSINLTSLWFIPVSRPTHSPVGIVLNL